jgi:hypothetical protein
MSPHAKCPICLGVDGRPATERADFKSDRSRIDCPACGTFIITGSASATSGGLDDETRRAISHDLRWKNELGSDFPQISTLSLEQYRRAAALPTIPEQVDSLLLFLTMKLRHAGRSYQAVDPALISAAGALDHDAATALVLEMARGGLLACVDASNLSGPNAIRIAPTLAGWSRAGDLSRGARSEPFAFMAMKYGDEALEGCVADVFRPAVQASGFALEILRDRPTAGLIDNYLRSRLRLCKFVIADLTHANNGAYWEAGFAEGLGKPVIYTCEREVFEGDRTHFDTNHSQTVVWDRSNLGEAHDQLLACIRNTLPDAR